MSFSCPVSFKVCNIGQTKHQTFTAFPQSEIFNDTIHLVAIERFDKANNRFIVTPITPKNIKSMGEIKDIGVSYRLACIIEGKDQESFQFSDTIKDEIINTVDAQHFSIWIKKGKKEILLSEPDAYSQCDMDGYCQILDLLSPIKALIPQDEKLSFFQKLKDKFDFKK